MNSSPKNTRLRCKLYVELIVVVTLCAAGGCATPPAMGPAKTPIRSATARPAPATEIGGASTPKPALPLAAPVILQGSGRLVGAPPAPDAKPAAAENGFQLNFADTDIAAVVAAVIGDGLNLPYVVDPQVKGTMTLQATRPLSRDELLAALEAALREQGTTLIEVEGVYHVVPSKEAPRRVASLRGPQAGAAGYGIYIVPLEFVGALEMEKILQPFAPEGGILRVDEARNLLLLAGTSQDLARLLNVVKTFDVDWLAGMSFALYPLEYVDAKSLVDELSEVFVGSKSPLAGVVRFVPLPRLNSVMVITPQQKYLKDAEAWIKRLDIGTNGPGRRIYVYDVQNGKADDLALSLNRILSLHAATGLAQPAASGASALTQKPTFTLGSEAGSAIRTLPPGASRTPSGLPYEAAPALGVRDESAAESGALKIVPNAENNALLILCSPSEFSMIDAALKRLDVLPLQVLIEASIAEVTLTDDLRYGLQWSYQSRHGPLVLSESANGSVASQFPGFSYLYTGGLGIHAVLNAIESITDIRVLSSPKLLVLNNHAAQLQIGDQVPIAVQSAISTNDANAPLVNTVQLHDTGVILSVTPRANKSGSVIIEIAQEVSNVVPTTTSKLDSPTIQQRRLSSTVEVHDGETIALGGLISDSRSRSRDGVPYLRKIPLLGDLFGSTGRNHSRTELIVLLTPRVLRSAQESDEVMKELREEFRGLRRLVPEIAKKLTAPVAATPSDQGTTPEDHRDEPKAPAQSPKP